MKFIDMFCGIGSIRMGFEQAGYTCVYSIEFDKYKRKMYEVIFGNEPDANDIRNVHGNDLPDAECWTFGAPCQDFSIAGSRAGMSGGRSSLVREVFRLIEEVEEEHKPEWLLYENVKGMFSSNNGIDYMEILNQMASLGYNIEWQLLNSRDFGVPQNRERVFTVGHLRRYGSRKIFPVWKSTANTADGNRQKIDVICYDPKQTFNRATPQFMNVSPCLTATMYKEPPCVKQIGNCMAHGKRENPNQGRIYDTSGIAPTLSKMEGGGRQPFIKEETRIRRLTPKECMRLQGVPDIYTDKLISAGISDTQIYRGAGDACTVNVIYEIAKKMMP